MTRKRGKLILRLLIAVAIIAAVLAALVVIGRNQIKNYEAQITSLETQITSNQQYVYVANTDIEAGSDVQQDINVIRQQIASGIDASLYIQDSDFENNYTALVDIAAGQPLMKNMVTADEVSTGVMEVEISVATLLVDSATNDVVDVRISFPDGSDYVVLSKKTMKNLIYDSSVWYTDLNEQEILTLTSAVTDAYTNTGTYIYLTRYTNPTIQEANVCTYPVRSWTHDTVNGTGETTDENIDRTSETYMKMTETLNLLARTRLENKIAELTQEELAAVAAGRGLQDTASSTAYAGQQAAQDAGILDENGNVIDSESSETTTTTTSDSATTETTDSEETESGVIEIDATGE